MGMMFAPNKGKFNRRKLRQLRVKVFEFSAWEDK
jgi:hypothetical protein